MSCFCGSETVTVNKRRFIIRDRIGEGGFATIELVEDKSNRRLYALKKITCHCSSDEDAVLKEAAYMRELHHANLVSLETSALLPCDNHNNISMATSVVLIVMPFYKGGSLADEIERLRGVGACMQEGQVREVLRGVCEGLHYLHTLKPVALAHRDIKPHNIMFTTPPFHYHRSSSNPPPSPPTIHPVLVDFGSMGPAVCEIRNSQEANKLQDMAAEKCSMPYRSPELFQVQVGSVVNEKVDVWSLGCLLHATCYHESPFDRTHQRGDSVALAVIAANVTLPPPYAKHDYSDQLVGLMRRTIQLDASSRPSVQDILNDLSQLDHHHDHDDHYHNHDNHHHDENHNHNNNNTSTGNSSITSFSGNKKIGLDDDDVLL